MNAFTLPTGSAGAGDIRITVTTDTYHTVKEYDASGNAAYGNNALSTDVTSTLPPYPDLQVTGLTVGPTTGLQSGGTLAVTWIDADTGTGPVTGAFTDHVVVKNLTTGLTLATADLPYDPTAAGNGPIAVGGSVARAFNYTLPLGSAGAGQIQVTVTTNDYNQVFEYNTAGPGGTSTATSNNTPPPVSVTAALAPYADLAASNVNAPTRIVGDPAQITVGWTVTNQGTSPGTVASWVDAVIASPDNNPADGQTLATFPHTGLLAVNGSYPQSQTITLPPHFEGQYYIFVQTNATGTVFENGSTTNNFAEALNVSDISPTPYADLVVSSISAQANSATGQPVSVTYTVTNQGIGVTNTDSWEDDVSLASDPAGQNIVTDLGALGHTGALAVDGSYTETATVTLPLTLAAGTYYLVVHTGGPYEFVYTNNNTAVSGPVAVTVTPAPALTPTALSASVSQANAGDKIDVTWTVQNVGPGAASGSWADQLTLKQVGGTGTSYSLGSFVYPYPLQSGLSYTRTEQVQLPQNVQGVFQLAVTTNSTGTLYEGGATANPTLSDPTPITLALPAEPDLQVQSVSAPTTGQAGGTVSLSFTIINQGTVPTNAPNWHDSVYLSLHGTLDGSATLLGRFANQSALDPNAEYQTQTGDLVIPQRFSGPAYLIVQTNSDDAVNEGPNGNNNTFVWPITISPLPPADLVTGAVAAPDQTYDGTTITVQYTVSNKGAGPTDLPSWADTIWLTHDPTRPNPSKGDVLLTTLTHQGVLGNDPSVLSPPGSYTVSTTVTLPKHISGQYYITPWADSFDTLIKSTFDVNINPDDPHQLNNDNYKARPITVLLTPPPDLVVTAVHPQATAVGGDNYTVSWTVQNEGTSPTEDSVLYDTVYLSNQPTLNAPGAKQWLLGVVEHDGAVAAGASYTAQQTFQLSPEISGTYVIVDTNTGGPNTLPTWEGPYTNNNTASASTLVTPLPTADLRVTSVTGPASNYSGEKTAVQWTVENFGARSGPAPGTGPTRCTCPRTRRSCPTTHTRFWSGASHTATTSRWARGRATPARSPSRSRAASAAWGTPRRRSTCTSSRTPTA